jgi:hypothetical protein
VFGFKLKIMNKALLLIATSLLFIASCSKESNTINGNMPNLDDASKKAKAISGTITMNPSFDYELPCDCPETSVGGTWAGTGKIKGLDKITSYIKPCMTPIYESDSTITSFLGFHIEPQCIELHADKEVIYCYTHPYDLYFDMFFTKAEGTCQVDFIGGTGKLLNASGGFTALVTMPVLPGPTSMTIITGSISY